MPRVQTRRLGLPGPVVGVVVLLAGLTVLTVAVGLSPRGWVVGVACGAVLAGLVTRSLTRHRKAGLGPADQVTMARAIMACALAALTADAFVGDADVAVLVALAAIALVLDGVDGQVARRTGTASAFGARFDMEVDAFLILVLSALVASEWGWWVLVLGLARYAFLAAGMALPWLRVDPPPRRWAKVVAVTVGVVLTVAASGVLPDPLTLVGLVVAVALLAESFARTVWDLWRLHGGGPFPWAAVSAVLAVLLVWCALLLPDRLDDVGPATILGIPVEGLVFAALVLLLPRRAARVVALVGGLGLALLTVLRVLDMGFWIAFSAPFHPVYDIAYARPGMGLLSATIGQAGAVVAVIGAGLVVIGLLTLLPWSTLRLTRLVSAHRRPSAVVLAGLTATAVVAAVSGARLGPGGEVASTSATTLVSSHVVQVRDDLRDEREFASALAQDDPVDHLPDDQLLTGLRGKDVLVVFVESYGRTALRFPAVESALRSGERQLQDAGFSARSGFLTSPTFGGLSWLAHSTLQSGLWVDNQRRYARLLTLDRSTLTSAFDRAGWRTVIDVPAAQEDWPEATTFYRFDQVYDRRSVGYAGPGFTWGAMPDQYTLAAFQRLELDRADRPPVMGQINLVSSHWPWPPQPALVDWDAIGDGSVYASMPVGASPEDTWHDSGAMTSAYGTSIAYSMDAITSFVRQLRDRNVVLVVLGDHQPSTLVAGAGADRDVPVSIIAADPDVLHRTDDWGWQPGLDPAADAPVWPMDAFRNRFVTTFSSDASAPAARPVARRPVQVVDRPDAGS